MTCSFYSAEIVKSCWNHDPRKRPTASTLCKRLGELQINKYNNNENCFDNDFGATIKTLPMLITGRKQAKFMLGDQTIKKSLDDTITERPEFKHEKKYDTGYPTVPSFEFYRDHKYSSGKPFSIL